MTPVLLDISVSGDTTIGELGVALGTLALAIVTGWLARRTGQGVEQTRESVEAIDRPFLVATPENFDMTPTWERGTREPTGSSWVLYAKLENFGKGPAIFDGIVFRDERGHDFAESPWEHDSILKEGESDDVGIPLREEPPDEGAALTLDLYYRSASGTRYVTSHRVVVSKQMRVHRHTFERAAAS